MRVVKKGELCRACDTATSLDGYFRSPMIGSEVARQAGELLTLPAELLVTAERESLWLGITVQVTHRLLRVLHP
jgi:hypothetical protein